MELSVSAPASGGRQTFRDGIVIRVVSHVLAFTAGMASFMVGAYLWLDKRILS